MFDRFQGADYVYSQYICKTVCQQVYNYQECGCIDPLQWAARSIILPGTNTIILAPLCDSSNTCYLQAMQTLINSDSLWQKYCSHCTQECSIVDFIVKPSSVAAPPEWFMDDIKMFVENSGVPVPTNWSTTWRTEILANYLGVDILSESYQIESFEQEATLDAVQVISNVGGHTGLWIGISFLSLMELVEMLYRLARYHLHLIRVPVRNN
ncbi:unnamed protein product [Didymodactylos carnosus]|nr:unnamed protein product [Didymodactylos carnosus]CAF4344482.1 unnamed protein product [Didymodactylos carnosus]